MSDHRPITRSRSKKSTADGNNIDGPNHIYVPPPLNIRKANATITSGRQHLDATSIGLAVGSPSDSPLPPLPPSSPDHYNVFSFPQVSPGRPRANTAESDQGGRERKPKGTRWRNLGALFSKKEAQSRIEEPPIYPTNPAIRKDWQCVPNKPRPVTRKRAGSDKEKGMELHNSLANKQIARGPSLLRRASTMRKGVRKKVPIEAGTEMPRIRLNPALNALSQNPPQGIHDAQGRENLLKPQNPFSLLQVEIPNVQLERYSIMFGNVLEPGSNAASKTSLVLPKQGIAEEPYPVDAPLEEPPRLQDLPKPHRREGSASSGSKSPSFSLFPSPQSSPSRSIVNKPLPKPSPLGRSVTEPTPNLPPRTPLKPSQSQDPNQLLTVAPGKENFPISKWSTTHSREGSHTTSHTRNQSYDPSIRSRNSHGHVAKLSFDNSYYSATSHSQKPSLDRSIRSQSDTQGSFFEASEFSPLSPPLSPLFANTPSTPAKPTATTNSNSSKQAFLNRAFPTRKSSLKRPNVDHKYSAHDLGLPEPPRPPYGNDGKSHGSSESVSSAAEVSIARQISISRRQRQLLVPVVAKTARQPLHPQLIDGDGRKSELVFFDNASPV